MEVIFCKDYGDVAVWGDKKVVADGFARNFLIPQGIALKADKRTLQKWDKKIDELRVQEEMELKKYQEWDVKLRNSVVKIPVKTSLDHRIFGSVTSSMIQKRICDEFGFFVEKRNIKLRVAIQSLGKHTADIYLHNKVSSEVAILVISE